MMNYQTHKELQEAVANFTQEYEDHPLLKDTVTTLKQAMYDLDTMLMSPGQKVVKSYALPTGQEPNGFSPKSQ
jgi:hypothetical protein